MEDSQTQTNPITYGDSKSDPTTETVSEAVDQSEETMQDATTDTVTIDEQEDKSGDGDQPLTTTSDSPLSMLQIESIIKRYLLDIQKLQERYKEKKSMFDDSFNNDANYKTLADKAKEATRLKTAAKQQLMKSPAITQLAQEVKEMKEEMADLEQSISDYLREYQKVSGSNQLETDDGQILEIVQVTKVVRKSKYRP